ncbi:MAG: LysR family transcriptional regulator [Clostridia bacterium]|nr:LysR family transcriptional regulator [Clostridia bacterium]
MEKMFMRAEDIAKVLDVSVSHAYKIMHQLNEELKKKGYLVVSGRVNRRYFYERIYNTEKGDGNAGI